MDQNTRHKAWLSFAILVGCAAGCVDRRFVITTDPPGAIVFDERNQPVGASPADRQFTYYGKYRFTIVHDGFETLVVEEKVQPPWYEFVGLDFFSEILLPISVRDVRRFHYTLQPIQMVSPKAIGDRAEELRTRGRAIGSPLPPRFPEAAPAPRPAPTPPPGAVPPVVLPPTQPNALPQAQPNTLPPSLPPVPQLGAPSPG